MFSSVNKNVANYYENSLKLTQKPMCHRNKQSTNGFVITREGFARLRRKLQADLWCCVKLKSFVLVFGMDSLKNWSEH